MRIGITRLLDFPYTLPKRYYSQNVALVKFGTLCEWNRFYILHGLATNTVYAIHFHFDICKKKKYYHEQKSAQKQNLAAQLPLKTRKQKQTAVTIDYFIIIRGNKIGLRKRTENIWNGLYEFPGNWIEKGEIKNPSNYIKTGNEILIESRKHLLTHKKMIINFHLGTGDYKDLIWVNKNELQDYSFPQVILDFMNDKIGDLF